MNAFFDSFSEIEIFNTLFDCIFRLIFFLLAGNATLVLYCTDLNYTEKLNEGCNFKHVFLKLS